MSAIRIVVIGSAVAVATVTPSAAAARTLMSCGDAPQTIDGRRQSEGSLRFVSRPRNCNYSADGTEAGRVRLERLRWRHWGSRTATATGYLRDNHDQDRNGFQRHR